MTLLRIKLNKTKSISYLIAFLSIISFNEKPAFAQVNVNEVTPTEVENINNIMNIEGGIQQGNNLFHSFDEFSIPAGMESIFKNNLDIQNIFVNVTGNEASNIEGTLTTQGTANLFFLNPNGIIFGKDASINIGGSFVASTADSVKFNDGSEFSASNNSLPSINIDFPIGLGLGSNPGAITVNGNGNGNGIIPDYIRTPTVLENEVFNISVKPANTFALIGNDININGGIVNVNDGRIELASINSGIVNFQPTNDGFTFNYENVIDYGDITFDNQAVLNASGKNKNDIILNSKNMALNGGSLILTQNQGISESGIIEINAVESLILSGTSFDGNLSNVIRSEAIDSGNGADINIYTQQLILRNGGRIGTTTYSDALAGSVKIYSSESVQLLENTLVNQNRQTYVVSGISSISSGGSGNAGNLQLTTSNLEVTSGASIQSSASGEGDGGNVIINAQQINVSGVNPNEQRTTSSAIIAGARFGNAGNLTIDTLQLQIKDGGTVAASTFGTGDAGELTINASENINISGARSNVPSSIRSNVRAVNSIASRERLGSPLLLSGRGGNLTINTPSLNVNFGGQITVGNEGLGDAGAIFLNAEEINLDNSASITAAAASGNGGDIQINSERLQFDNNSQITTKAANQGNGGNITINTDNIIAKKNSDVTTSAKGGDGGNININATNYIVGIGDSDITADAVDGNGGNIRLSTNYLLGLKERSLSTSLNDITASSRFGITGNIEIDLPEVANNLTESTTNLAFESPQQPITQVCSTLNAKSGTIADVGFSGLSENPTSYFDSPSAINYDHSNISPLKTQISYPAIPVNSPQLQPDAPLIEANQIITNPNGTLSLVSVPNIEDNNANCDVTASKK